MKRMFAVSLVIAAGIVFAEGISLPRPEMQGGKSLMQIVLGQSVGYPPDDGYIGRQAAIRVALAHAGFHESSIRRLKCELDREDGVMVYEVEFKKDGFEYDYDIDAKTGTIMKTKKEGRICVIHPKVSIRVTKPSDKDY